MSRLGEELTAIVNEVAGLCGAARNCGGDTGKRTIASVLLEASINLNFRHNGMFKCRGEVRGGYWWGEPAGKEPLGRPRHRCEDKDS